MDSVLEFIQNKSISNSIKHICLIFSSRSTERICFSSRTVERNVSSNSMWMMEHFLIIREKIALLGFISNHRDFPYYPFTGRHLAAHLIYILNISSVFLFVIYVAESANEYMHSFYILTATIAIYVSYVTVAYKTNKLFDIFSGIEKCIHDRKYLPKIRREKTKPSAEIHFTIKR